MIRIIMSIVFLLNVTLSATLLTDGLAECKKGNMQRAAELYNEACDGGDKYACIELGVLHVNGDGVKKDRKKAKKLFTKSCKSRHSKACFYLGVLYKQGSEDIKQDKRRAKLLFGKACNIGYEKACEQYRLLHVKGY